MDPEAGRDRRAPAQNARRRTTRAIRITKKPGTRTSRGWEPMKLTASLKTWPALPKKSTGWPRSGAPPPPTPPPTCPAVPLLMPPPYSITRASSHPPQVETDAPRQTGVGRGAELAVLPAIAGGWSAGGADRLQLRQQLF